MRMCVFVGRGEEAKRGESIDGKAGGQRLREIERDSWGQGKGRRGGSGPRRGANHGTEEDSDQKGPW